MRLNLMGRYWKLLIMFEIKINGKILSAFAPLLYVQCSYAAAKFKFSFKLNQKMFSVADTPKLTVQILPQEIRQAHVGQLIV